MSLDAPPSLWGRVPIPFGRLPIKARHLRPYKLAIPGIEYIAGINRWVNDTVMYRRENDDHWEQPEVTLARRYGDCEDIALVKQAALRHLDIPCWVLLVKDTLSARKVNGKWRAGHHAVALTRDFILDNYTSRLLPIESMGHYIPVLAFDAERTWLYGEPV